MIAGRIPNDLDALPLKSAPLRKTYHTLYMMRVYGERSHQLAAEPPKFAIRLLLADVPVPLSKYASFAPSTGK